MHQKPTPAGTPSARRAVVYLRPGCHLCDQVKTLLGKYGFSISEVDIDTDPQLVERYGTVIPVVTIDGRERFRGCINEVLLRRLLRAGRQL
ncbi:MAG TPA: glutaredoxin family protein [Pirellulales bacterium]|nr:glutaredoxin family protein [Pirellulales bacterium]